MITYINGDATRPQSDGPKLIAHVCNDEGGWGKGFVLALSNRWAAPEIAYRRWHRDEDRDSDFGLGRIQLVPVAPDITVVNMIAQHSYLGPGNQQPLRLGALDLCLHRLAQEALRLGASVHMPRIGSGHAGGNWEEIEPMIARRLADHQVFIYDRPSGPEPAHPDGPRLGHHVHP